MKLNLSASAINITHYDHVIPSRDCILSLFDKVKHYLSYEQISHSTGLSEKIKKKR